MLIHVTLPTIPLQENHSYANLIEDLQLHLQLQVVYHEVELIKFCYHLGELCKFDYHKVDLSILDYHKAELIKFDYHSVYRIKFLREWVHFKRLFKLMSEATKAKRPSLGGLILGTNVQTLYH